MKRISVLATAGLLWLSAAAQPKGMQPRSTYEMVDEVRKELKLDQKQFEKVYSAYDKYNKAVFGDVDKNGMRPTPPAGGPRGGHGGHGGPGMGGRPGGGDRPDFGGAPGGGRPDFGGAPGGNRPGSDMHRPGNDNPNMKAPKPEDIEKMEKKRAKEEAKLVKSMQKLFKKDPAAFARWQTIRERQLKQLTPPPMLPAPDRK